MTRRMLAPNARPANLAPQSSVCPRYEIARDVGRISEA